MRMMRKYWPLFIPVVLLGFGLFIFIGGEVVKWLWNWLVPPLFGLPMISFWQALALLVLCRILFGGFGMKGGAFQISCWAELQCVVTSGALRTTLSRVAPVWLSDVSTSRG